MRSLAVERDQPGEYVIACPMGDHRRRGMLTVQ
jgi:hypothetical protein